MSLSDEVLAYALALGFDRAGIIPLGPPAHGDAFADWLAAGYGGEMAYLAARAAERLDPAAWLGDAASLILIAADYTPGPPPPTWADPAHGRFACYAWAADYHDRLKARLHALDAFIRARTGRTALGKACVDTAPLLERDFAAQAGLGFIGRNTCLITPGLGSWTFLAALAVPEDLTLTLTLAPCGAASDAPRAVMLSGLTSQRQSRRDPSEASPFGGRDSSLVFRRNTSHIINPLRVTAEAILGATGPADQCGRCTRCLDACPTAAFVAPRLLDARRCISYLTIELRGPIPRELRPAMGNWVFGCDVCQEVCPYNRAARARHVPARPGSAKRARGICEVPGTFELLDLLALDDAAFRARFRGTAILRTKRRGLVRNACVAAGNWGDEAAVPALIGLLTDPEPLIRGHAAWALGRIGGRDAVAALAARAAVEDDAWVREEIAAAL
jgi:epoxyqueuosine reductase